MGPAEYGEGRGHDQRGRVQGTKHNPKICWAEQVHLAPTAGNDPGCWAWAGRSRPEGRSALAGALRVMWHHWLEAGEGVQTGHPMRGLFGGFYLLPSEAGGRELMPCGKC